MAAASSTSSLKEYLKKYQSSSDDQTKKKKKKKTAKNGKPKNNSIGAGVLVVDEDPVWQKPIVEEEEESAEDEAPQIDEDIEVKRLKRLEAIRSRRPYNAISEDGSGWVSISDQHQSLNPTNRDSDDLSPPRQQRPRFDTPSPDRELTMEDSGDGDLSLGRQLQQPLDIQSTVPEARATGSSGNVDISRPRRNRNRSSVVDDDLSPPRKNRNRSAEIDDDISPPRRNRDRLRDVDDDLSLPRRNKNRVAEVDDDDLSPPRKNKNRSPDADLSSTRKTKEPSLARDVDILPPRKKREPSIAKDIRRTGLLSAEEIRKENEKKRKDEISRFASMDASMSGKGAEVIFRDKEGRRIKKEDILKAQEEERPKETKLEWGKGLAQKREAEARMKELDLEKDKPFARTRDDPDLDIMLKERIRWGDPMAHLVKKNADPIFDDLGNDEKMKESGFIIPQSIPSHSWIKRGIDLPPNRYGIRPGRHWDGVDRSNGYEKQLFKRQSEKRATETEAYMWSVADM